MIYMFLMFIAWGLREVALMPTWVCIVLTVLTGLRGVIAITEG